MHCMLCKPQTLGKADMFMDVVKQKTRLCHSGLLWVFFACGIHAKLQPAEGGIPALSLASQVPCCRWDVSYHVVFFPVLTDELFHRDGAGAYNQAIQGLEVLKAVGGQ